MSYSRVPIASRTASSDMTSKQHKCSSTTPQASTTCYTASGGSGPQAQSNNHTRSLDSDPSGSTRLVSAAGSQQQTLVARQSNDEHRDRAHTRPRRCTPLFHLALEPTRSVGVQSVTGLMDTLSTHTYLSCAHTGHPACTIPDTCHRSVREDMHRRSVPGRDMHGHAGAPLM